MHTVSEGNQRGQQNCALIANNSFANAQRDWVHLLESIVKALESIVIKCFKTKTNIKVINVIQRKGKYPKDKSKLKNEG